MIKISLGNRHFLLNNGKGLGNYGLPANDPAHVWCVASGTDRGNGYQGYMSIYYAMGDECSWLTDAQKQAIARRVGLTRK